MLQCLTSCNNEITGNSSKSTKTTSQIKEFKTGESMKENESISESLKSKEIKAVTDVNKQLEAVTLSKEEKDNLIDEFFKSQFSIYLKNSNSAEVPSEIRVTQNIDDYNDVCYSVYKYDKDKLFAFLLREKPDSTKSALTSNKTIYSGLFLVPVDKVYSIEDFKNIETNQSDLSDVKKIYKYADILFKQELQVEDSKKKCSINIMSEGSGITISFEKKMGKYVVTNIEDNADESFVSMIADVDKNFD